MQMQLPTQTCLAAKCQLLPCLLRLKCLLCTCIHCKPDSPRELPACAQDSADPLARVARVMMQPAAWGPGPNPNPMVMG